MLISRLTDSLVAEEQEEERREVELKCKVAQKVKDLEDLKTLWRLRMEEDKEEEMSTAFSAPDLTKELAALQAEESSLKSLLHQRQQDLLHLSSSPHNAGGDLELVREMLTLTELRDTKEKKAKEVKQRVEIQQKEREVVRELTARSEDKAEKIYRGLQVIQQNFAAVREVIPNVDDISATMEVVQSDLPLFDAVPALSAAEERRRAAHQLLHTRRKEWKEAESALIAQYEAQLQALRNELELSPISPTVNPAPESPKPQNPPQPVKPQAADPQSPSPKRSLFKPREKPQATDMDLESLLGNASPSMARIKEVTQKYSSAKETSD